MRIESEIMRKFGTIRKIVEENPNLNGDLIRGLQAPIDFVHNN